MSSTDLEDLIDRHEAFLECRPVDRPLIGHWVGGYYPAEQFPRGISAWGVKAVLRPPDVSFEPFAEDYDRLYESHRACGDDFPYVGSAYWGVPWLEAILGCSIAVAGANCRAEPCLKSLDDGSEDAKILDDKVLHDMEHLHSDLDANPWMDVLLRFTRDLVAFSGNRFPVGPPLLRGPGDASCAMLGSMAFVTGFIDYPERMKRLLEYCTEIRLAILRRLHEIIPSWHGSHAAGGYPSRVWCRQTVAYHQEDCAALLNPRIFREFLLPPARRMCAAAKVNFIHLHSACLYPVDVLLEDSCYDILQINIDHEGAGPPVRELMKTFHKIQAAGRPLLLWGDCCPEDWNLIRSELNPAGLSLQPFAKDTEMTGVSH